MNTGYHKLTGAAGIVFGICNLIPISAEERWYCIFCFLLLGIPEILAGFITIRSKEAKIMRAQAWGNFLVGLSILFLALSEFYVSQTLSAFNFIAAAGLIITGLAGFYGATRRLGLTLVP